MNYVLYIAGNQLQNKYTVDKFRKEPKTNIFVCVFLGQNGRPWCILNAELYELKKTSKADLYKIRKRRYAFRFPSHLWSYAVVLCNCPILRLHTGDKPYETSKSLWLVLFSCNDPMLSNQNRCGRDKMQVFIFYDTSHKEKWQTFFVVVHNG